MRRRPSPEDDIRCCTLGADPVDDPDLPYGGDLDRIIDEFIVYPTHVLAALMLERNMILIDADQAAARSATAEGKAGLHQRIDEYIEFYGHPENINEE